VPRVTIENWLRQSYAKVPFVDEYFVLVLAALSAVVFVISIGDLNLSNQPTLIEPIPVLGPLNVIILVINFLGKLYFAYGPVRFWSSVVLGICLGALSRTLASIWAPSRIG
jgi:riboflavin transporter FmnP